MVEHMKMLHSNQNNYLVLELINNDGFTVDMIERNEITGLLPVFVQKEEEHEYIYYNISNLQTLKNFHVRHMYGYEEIRQLIFSIQQLLLTIDEYLLCADEVILQEDMIFSSYDKRRFYYCYYPGNEISFSDQLVDFIADIMNKTDHEDKKAVESIYSLYQAAASDNCCFSALYGIIKNQEDKIIDENRNHFDDKSIEEGITNPRESVSTKTRQDEIGTDESASSKKAVVIKEKSAKIEQSIIRKIKEYLVKLYSDRFIPKEAHRRWTVMPIPGQNDHAIKEIDEEASNSQELLSLAMSGNRYMHNDLEEPDSNTCLLEVPEERQNFVRLVPVKNDGNDGNIIIEHSTTIGKLKEQVDCVLNYPQVSRMHAQIILEGEKWMIEDMNSKNGTFINGTRIPPYTKQYLTEGDCITFADRSYVFYDRKKT